MERDRVVVTGLGVVSSLSRDVSRLFEALVEGHSGIGPIRNFSTEGLATRIGGEVADWSAPYLAPDEARRLDRFAQFALHGAIDAASDSGVDFARCDPRRCGAIVGTGVGGVSSLYEGLEALKKDGPASVEADVLPRFFNHSGADAIACHFRLHGKVSSSTSACASAAHAIGDAYRAIRYGRADVMLTGGAEAPLAPVWFASFNAMHALSTRNDDPAGASRPFDRDRDGFIMAEGAGILVLESYAHAVQRGARIYAEIIGYGESSDGLHIAAPDGDGCGAAGAMEAALRDARINPESVGYINAHGTSTPLGDVAETRAIKRLFQQRSPMISSTKSMTGHLLGAAGGLEAIIAVKAIETGVVPPTINLEAPDDECDLDYVPNSAREQDVRIAMNNSFGFGGHNVSMVLAAA